LESIDIVSSKCVFALDFLDQSIVLVDIKEVDLKTLESFHAAFFNHVLMSEYLFE